MARAEVVDAAGGEPAVHEGILRRAHGGEVGGFAAQLHHEAVAAFEFGIDFGKARGHLLALPFAGLARIPLYSHPL